MITLKARIINGTANIPNNTPIYVVPTRTAIVSIADHISRYGIPVRNKNPYCIHNLGYNSIFQYPFKHNRANATFM